MRASTSIAALLLALSGCCSQRGGCTSSRVPVSVTQLEGGGAVVNGVRVDGVCDMSMAGRQDGCGTVQYRVIEGDDGFVARGSKVAVIDRR